MKIIVSFIFRVENCTNQEQKDFTTDFSSKKLDSFDEIDIPVSFYPEKIGKYEKYMLFKINSVQKRIQFFGEGVGINLKVTNLENAVLNFGEIYVGSCKKRTIKIHSDSKVTLNGFVDLLTRLPISKETEKKIIPEFELSKTLLTEYVN